MRTQAVVFLLVSSLAGCDGQIGKAEDAVKLRLKDPSSAEFKDMRKTDDGKYVCGEVNAKNSMGGYTGFSGFVVGPMDEAPLKSSFEVADIIDNCYRSTKINEIK